MGCERMNRLCQTLLNICGKLAWLPPLATRITVGWVFAETGYGKLFNNLSGFIHYLESLGIPYAGIQGPLVAICELVFGALLMLGCMTRISALPLIGIMVVAIPTAKMQDISSASDLFSLFEFLFIILLCWLVIYGAGSVSIDRFCRKKTVSAAP